jgi:membrane peptidoglycan carboxypeptidase
LAKGFRLRRAIAQFGEDPPQLTLPEGRDAAGIIPAANVYVPGKHPNRGDSRRNLILRAMPHTDAMRTENYENAKQAELEIIPLKADATDAPYLVDFNREELMKDYSEEEVDDEQSRRLHHAGPRVSKSRR